MHSFNASPQGAPWREELRGHELSSRPQLCPDLHQSPARRYRRGVLHEAADLLHHVVAAVLAECADELGQAGLGPADGPVLQGGVGALVVGRVAVGESRHLPLAGVAQELVDVLPLAPHLRRHQLEDVDACGAEKPQVRQWGLQTSGLAKLLSSSNGHALLFLGKFVVIIIIIVLTPFLSSGCREAAPITC